MTQRFEYLKVKSSFHLFSYKHLAFLDIQEVSFACLDTGGMVGGSQSHRAECGFRVGWRTSEVKRFTE